MNTGITSEKREDSRAAEQERTLSGSGVGSLRHALVSPYPMAGLLFVAGLLFYLATLAPSVVTLFDDSLEFQLVTYQLGIAHPTGYPLYTILGKLFTFLPVGNVAYRVNLMSAVFGAATLAGVYLLIVHTGASSQLSRPGWTTQLGGIFGALLLATGSVFWLQATVAEVYTLNAFLVALLLLLVVRPLTPPGDHRRFYGVAFLFGLSLTHHRTTLLLLPTLALYFYLTRKQHGLTWKTLASGLVLGLIPLLLYLYLPWRGHMGSLDGAYQNTWAGFWRQVGAGGYGTFVVDNPFGHQRDAAFYWNLMQSQFYTLVPGFVGIFYLFWVGQRRILALIGVTFLTYFTFNLFYRVTDIEVFFIPVFLVWAVWSGIGVSFLLQITAGMRRALWRFGLTGLILVVFVFILFQNIHSARPLLDQRNTWQIHDYGLDILQQPLDEQAVMVGILGEMTLVRYFQQTLNLRPDLQTLAADAEADRLATVEKLLGQGQPVYLTRQLPGAPERWSLSAVGPLIRVNPTPLTELPANSIELDQPVTPEITLVGYRVSRAPHTGAGPAPVRLTLFWQTKTPLSIDLKVSARLLDPTGEVITANDAVPVHFAYPTTAWRPGEIVADGYDLPLPVDAPPGRYIPLLIWYNPAQNAAEVGRVELGPVTVN
ncbi:MAG: DUF2723 domain-containing protein [Anaerolineae bacterium]|nr:DUF2723 domain-containing protein [Anaerolineae bacterium]